VTLSLRNSPPALVESIHAHAVREINALEQRIADAEDAADQQLWEQAQLVVAQLDAGLSPRELARQWLNLRTGAPYDEKHVRLVRRVWTASAELTPRPRFRDLYNELGNAKPHLTRVTGDVEWYSPTVLVEAARTALGTIDFDPCSCEIANQVVRADTYLSKDDDALARQWSGTVWMNPPYEEPWCRRFIEGLVDRYRGDCIEAAVVLTNNATDTRWFATLASEASAFCFTLQRYPCWKPDGTPSNPLQGQVLSYLGPDRAAFARAFSDLGLVLVRPC
jgi:DNA N-6-adenine-methyltransferase Dam